LEVSEKHRPRSVGIEASAYWSVALRRKPRERLRTSFHLGFGICARSVHDSRDEITIDCTPTPSAASPRLLARPVLSQCPTLSLSCTNAAGAGRWSRSSKSTCPHVRTRFTTGPASVPMPPCAMSTNGDGPAPTQSARTALIRGECPLQCACPLQGGCLQPGPYRLAFFSQSAARTRAHGSRGTGQPRHRATAPYGDLGTRGPRHKRTLAYDDRRARVKPGSRPRFPEISDGFPRQNIRTDNADYSRSSGRHSPVSYLDASMR